jgi:hypothetical protein
LQPTDSIALSERQAITLNRTATLGGRVKYMPILTTGTPYRLVIGAVKNAGGNTYPGFSLSFVG